jgi:hypothetical protein
MQSTAAGFSGGSAFFSTDVNASRFSFETRFSVDGRRLQLLYALHFVDAGDFAQPGNDPVQVGDIGDIEHDIDEGVGAFVGACLDVTDVGICVADDGGYLLENAGAVVTVSFTG